MQSLDNITELRLVFTDPESGKQLRIFCRTPKLTSEQCDVFYGVTKIAREYFVEDLQFNDKLP